MKTTAILTLSDFNIQLKLYKATERLAIKRHLRHKADNGEISYQKVCKYCGEIVEDEDVVKTIELDGSIRLEDGIKEFMIPERGIYVKNLLSRDEAQKFIHSDNVYYLKPVEKKENEKSFLALMKSLEILDAILLVEYVIRDNVNIGYIDKNATLYSILYEEEIREKPELERRVSVSPKEIQKMTKNLLRFRKTKYKITNIYHKKLVNSLVNKQKTMVVE